MQAERFIHMQNKFVILRITVETIRLSPVGNDVKPENIFFFFLSSNARKNCFQGCEYSRNVIAVV